VPFSANRPEERVLKDVQASDLMTVNEFSANRPEERVLKACADA